jgi:L-fuconolactonase
VWCKLSGLVTEASWSSWTTADLRPHVDHLLAVFGAERLIFGSDWPVCELAASYGQVMAAATETLAALAPDDRQKIMYGNALHVYRPLGIGPKEDRS